MFVFFKLGVNFNNDDFYRMQICVYCDSFHFHCQTDDDFVECRCVCTVTAFTSIVKMEKKRQSDRQRETKEQE